MKYVCFKCQKIKEKDDVDSVALSSESVVYMCSNCIQGLGKLADERQVSESPKLNTREVK